MTDRRVNRGRHSAHLAALLLTAYLRLHRRGTIGFPRDRAREMGARNGLSVTRKKLRSRSGGLTDPELSDSRRSLLDYSAITRRVAVPVNRYLTNI